MWLGLAVLAAGFITMMFGDKNNYGEDFVGITLGPVLLVAGFIIEFFAIMLRDDSAVVSNGTAAAPSEPGTTNFVAPVATPTIAAPTPAAPAYKRL